MTKTHCNLAAGFSNANAGSTGSFHGASLNIAFYSESNETLHPGDGHQFTSRASASRLLQEDWDAEDGTKRAELDFWGNKEFVAMDWCQISFQKRLIWHTTALSRGNGFRTVLPEGLRILKLLQAEFSLNSELSRLPQQQSCDNFPKPPSTFVSACGLFAISYRGLSHFTVRSWVKRGPHHSEHLIRRKRCHLPRCTE